MELPCGTFNQTYAQDMAVIRTKSHWGFTIFGLIFLFCLPLWVPPNYIHIVNYTFIWLIAALGLQIAMGYTGLISFAHAAFLAVGAYTTAILTGTMGLSFWIALPASGIIAGLIGMLAGAPSLRIKGFYLALATIAIQFIIMWLVLHLDITGSVIGLRTPAPSIGGLELKTDAQMFYLIAGMMVLMTFFTKNLIRSKIGRAFIAIRDNDLAARVMGINIFRYKLLSFFIACAAAGIAGSLWAALWGYVSPEQFNITMSLFYIGMLIIGGLGSIVGVFFGVFTIRALEELVGIASPSIAAIFPAIGFQPAAALAVSFFGLIIILSLIFMPRGLAHQWNKIKASYRIFPFNN